MTEVSRSRQKGNEVLQSSPIGCPSTRPEAESRGCRLQSPPALAT